jgi:hypothetical protein
MKFSNYKSIYLQLSRLEGKGLGARVDSGGQDLIIGSSGRMNFEYKLLLL